MSLRRLAFAGECVPTLPVKPLLSPAARTALIIGAFFFTLITMGVYFVYKEAAKGGKRRELTQQVNDTSTGEMVWIPGGTFTMGGIGDNIPPDELPLHDVKIDGFWID